MTLLQRILTGNELVNDIGRETIQLIMRYAKTWQVLLAYDEDQLQLPEKGGGGVAEVPLAYESALSAIQTLKSDLAERGESTELFGREREQGLKGLLGNIE